MNHPQVVQSPIVNYCLKVKIDGHTEPQLVPKCLLYLSVRELHNKLVISTIDGGLKEAREEDDNIFISDYTLRSLLPPQLKIFHQYIRSYVVANVAYLPKLCIHNYYFGVIVIKKSSRISEKMLKTEGLRGNQIAYMKHIKMYSCHMGVIFTPKHMKWQSQQCVHTNSKIMS